MFESRWVRHHSQSCQCNTRLDNWSTLINTHERICVYYATLVSAVLAGCVGEDASEIIDDTTPEINSEDERPEDTTRVEKEDCEERGGTWTETPDREGESYCDFDDEDDRGEHDSEITQEDCEERGGTWDEQTRDCSFSEERPEEEEQAPEPTDIPSCNVTASQGMNSTANPENWPELQSGKWNDIEGLTQIVTLLQLMILRQ